MLKYYDIGLSDLQRAFAPKERLNVWQWAEKNVTLSSRASPWPGPYRTNFCPFVRQPQECHTDFDTRLVVLCWSSRSSKTETLLNPIRYSIACEPQPFMIVMPSDKLGRTFSRSRFQPSVDDCAILNAEKMEDPDLYSTMEMHFKRCSGWITGANSPANLSSKGIGLLDCDEIDKWPQQQTRETGALQLALERIKDRWNGKAYLSSTPTIESAQIWVEFLLSDQRYYFVPCCNCGHYQRLSIDNLKWDKDAKLGEFKWDFAKVRRTTRYECESCGFGHTDQHKSSMLTKGEWKPLNTTADPERKGYHLNSMYPSWISFGKVSTAFLQSFGSPEDRQNFHNSWLALPIGSSEDRLRLEQEIARRSQLRADRTPKDHVALMTIDVQRANLWFVIRAWDKDKNSIRLEYGQLPGFEEAEVLVKKWEVATIAVDSAYAARQKEVIEWCALHPGWMPLLGSPSLIQPFRFMDIDLDFGLMRGRKVPSLRIRPMDFKEILFERMNNQVPKWLIAGDAGDDYKKHMSGETRHMRRGPRGTSIIEYIPHGHHDLKDCEVYQIALYEAVRSFVFEIRPTDVGPPIITPSTPSVEFAEHTEIDNVRQLSDHSFAAEERDRLW